MPDVMNPETAELGIVDTAGELVVAPPAPRRRRPGRLLGARLAALRADPCARRAARDSWRALWSSRLLALGAGLGAVAAFGLGPQRTALDPPGVTRGFGWLGDVLAAPVARWDSDWYLVIARFGYRPDLAPFTSPRMAYFPLYPLAVRGVGLTGAPLVLAGALVSLAAFALALYGIHRLTTLELARAGGPVLAGSRGGEVARLAVLVTAFSPMAFFFSAVYSESLFLALSVGIFWYARTGHWARVALLGALAGATRSTGLVLVLPALMIYLYGPREDRPPDRGRGRSRAPATTAGIRAGARRRARALLATLSPRYALRPEVLWLALMPAGVVLYSGWLALNGADALGPFHAAQAWGHHLVGPFIGAWDGLSAGFDGARQLLSLQRSHVYFGLAGGDPFIVAWHNLMELGFLVAAVPMIVGVLRRLPLAYGAYAIAAIAIPLSYPVAPQPLMSMPRYLLVLFPLGIWLAAWLAERPRLRRPALLASCALMVLFAAQFATWHWVA
jgi:hypothetical protein